MLEDRSLSNGHMVESVRVVEASHCEVSRTTVHHLKTRLFCQPRDSRQTSNR